MAVVVVNGGGTCELGDGCHDSQLGKDVLPIARTLYASVGRLVQSNIYEAVVEHTQHRVLVSVDGGTATDHRLLTARLWQLSPSLVQYATLLDGDADGGPLHGDGETNGRPPKVHLCLSRQEPSGASGRIGPNVRVGGGRDVMPPLPCARRASDDRAPVKAPAPPAPRHR